MLLPEIFTSLWALIVEFIWKSRHKVFKVGQFQGVPHLLLRIHIEGVEVHTERSREQHWVLRNQLPKDLWGFHNESKFYNIVELAIVQSFDNKMDEQQVCHHSWLYVPEEWWWCGISDREARVLIYWFRQCRSFLSLPPRSGKFQEPKTIFLRRFFPQYQSERIRWKPKILWHYSLNILNIRRDVCTFSRSWMRTEMPFSASSRPLRYWSP